MASYKTLERRLANGLEAVPEMVYGDLLSEAAYIEASGKSFRERVEAGEFDNLTDDEPLFKVPDFRKLTKADLITIAEAALKRPITDDEDLKGFLIDDLEDRIAVRTQLLAAVEAYKADHNTNNKFFHDPTTDDELIKRGLSLHDIATILHIWNDQDDKDKVDTELQGENKRRITDEYAIGVQWEWNDGITPNRGGFFCGCRRP